MPKKGKKRIRKKIKKVGRSIKKEVLFNVPNTLTLLRLLLAFIVVYMLFSGYSRLSVAVVFAIAALTDLFDGYLARKLKQTTKIGARLDQVIDRIFAAIIVISLGAYFLIYTHESILVLFLIMSREIIGLPGFIIRIIRGTDTYKVRYIGKLTTFVQSFAIAFIMLGLSWSIYFAIVTCLIGVISGFDYLKDSVT